MKPTLIFIALLITLLGGSSQFLPKTISLPNYTNVLPTFYPSPQPMSPQYAKVTKVIDGDTIELENGQKVRYIGIDSPETQHPSKGVECFGKEATQKNKELVEGKIVKLEKDVSETDRYKRLLRYVYLTEQNATSSGIFINEYLVKEGYAFATTFPPDVAYAEHFAQQQNAARTAQKGLWKSCGR